MTRSQCQPRAVWSDGAAPWPPRRQVDELIVARWDAILLNLRDPAVMGSLAWTEVRQPPRRPGSWADLSLFYICTPTEMRGPDCIRWSGLTQCSLARRAT
jgi:hypothetical protein